MEELIVRVNNLIDKIDNSDIVKDIKISNERVMNDKPLLKLLEELYPDQKSMLYYKLIYVF